LSEVVVMPDTSDPSALAEQLLVAVIKIRRVLEESLRPHGISLPRKGLLGLLADGPARMSELADGLGVTPRTVTELVDGLERDGLVERKDDPTDRRARVVSLTDTGRDVDALAKTARNQAVDAIFADLPEDQRVGLAQALSTLNASLARMPAGPRDH
jgi:DNA-binding MarR family transcriptional regulator